MQDPFAPRAGGGPAAPRLGQLAQPSQPPLPDAPEDEPGDCFEAALPSSLVPKLKLPPQVCSGDDLPAADDLSKASSLSPSMVLALRQPTEGTEASSSTDSFTTEPEDQPADEPAAAVHASVAPALKQPMEDAPAPAEEEPPAVENSFDFGEEDDAPPEDPPDEGPVACLPASLVPALKQPGQASGSSSALRLQTSASSADSSAAPPKPPPSSLVSALKQPGKAKPPRAAATGRATVMYTATVTYDEEGQKHVNLEEVEVGRANTSVSICSSNATQDAPEAASSSPPPHGMQTYSERTLAADKWRRSLPTKHRPSDRLAIKGRRSGNAPSPSLMRTCTMLDSKVLCSGTLLASKGAAGGDRGRYALLEGQLGAGFRARWFAIVAFDRGGLMDVRKRLELVLLWTASEEKFEQLIEQLQESEEVPNSYHMRMPTGSSALRLPQVLGSITLRSAKKTMETRRLDLPDSLFSAIEIHTMCKKYLLGVESQDDLSRWLHALRAGHQRMHRLKALGTGLSMARSRMTTLMEEEEECNKWVQEVGMPTLFHILWYVMFLFSFVWIFSLVFLFNPYLSPCQHEVATYADEATGQCFESATGALVDGCLSWGRQTDIMGSWRSWVSDLQPSGLFDSRIKIEGEGQTCFEEVGGWKFFWFWGFVVVEIISKACALGFSQLNWRVVVRGARMLDEMEPAFAERDWPEVDIIVCHYSEPAEETMETLAKMLEMDYPPSKLHIYVCDDGYFKSDYSKVDEKCGVHWPTPQNNKRLIQLTGDVRQLTEDLMAEYTSTSEQDGMSSVASAASEQVRALSTCGTGTATRHVRHFKHTKEVIPEPYDPDRRVARTDCAVGFVQDTYSVPGMPKVSYVARLKPQTHHAKAGNINNALYNLGSRGQYVAVFDNDMQPHAKFLTSTLPLFFDERPVQDDDDLDDSRCPYTDDPDVNQVAYVQTPQYFKATWLMSERGDPLSHANVAFFDSGLLGMDGYDSVMFVGTNCVWRREALDSVGGIQYGTVSEDYWTGYTAQCKGWDAAYLRKDRQGPKENRFRLSEGNVPENVAASMAQRKRWHKGSVELFLGAANKKDPEWTPPPARAPQRQVPGRIRRYRQAQYALLRLAWVNVFPPLFYTALVIGGLWNNALWFHLNPNACYFIMIPYGLLASVVPSLGDITVPAEQIMSSLPEYFTYAPVRLVGTFEAFYSKVTGRAAQFDNTGGIRSGSISEVPILLFMLALAVGLVRSVIQFMFFDLGDRLSEVLPIWGFACYMLLVYWNTARVSVQEFLEWGYDSLSGSLVAHWLLVPGIMAATVAIRWREEQGIM